MTITLVVAMADNGVIGRDGGLPWLLPADLKHFKAVTLGKPVIMGRRTWLSIGRPLPGRRNIVVTRGDTLHAAGIEIVPSPEAALKAASAAGEVMVIGGAAIYRAFLPMASRIELTEIHGSVDGDTYFPEWSRADWMETRRENHPATLDAPAFSFVTLVRASRAS